MSIEAPKISPGRGRWPKSHKKRAIRKRNLDSATQIKAAIERESGFARSRGGASKCKNVVLSEDEAAELLRRIGRKPT